MNSKPGHFTLGLFATDDRKNPDISRQIFLIILIFFLVLQGYGIYYYKLRIQFEAASDIVESMLYKNQHFSVANDRYATILNKFLLKPSLWLHLPLELVARICCFNDALFYLTVCFSIIFFTKRYDYAAAVLAAPVLIDDVGFYAIVNEIFLSGAIMIFYMAIYRHYEGRYKNIILGISIPCIVYSHPVMLIVLLVFLMGLYKSLEQIWQDKFLLLFLLFNIIIRLNMLTGYDHERLHALSISIHPADWPAYIFRYIGDYWYFMLMLCVVICFSMFKSHTTRENAGLLLFPLLLIFSFENNYWLHNLDSIKYLYPVHLFILMQFFVTLPLIARKYKKAILLVSILIFSAGLYRVMSGYVVMSYRASVHEVLSKMCQRQDPSWSKWYISNDSLKLIGSDRKWDNESILFSALLKQDPTIQLLSVSKTEIEKLKQTPEDKLAFFSNEAMRDFDPFYLHFRPSPYRELVVDSADKEYLKRFVKESLKYY